MSSLRLQADPLHSLAFGSIGAAYMGIGAAFDESARMVYISNLTDESLLFSWDGITDHFPVYAYSALLLTITQNNEDVSEGFSLPALRRLYVKQLGIPSAGSVYVTQFRGVNDA